MPLPHQYLDDIQYHLKFKQVLSLTLTTIFILLLVYLYDNASSVLVVLSKDFKLPTSEDFPKYQISLSNTKINTAIILCKVFWYIGSAFIGYFHHNKKNPNGSI